MRSFIICIFHQMLLKWIIKKTHNACRGNEKCIQNSVWNTPRNPELKEKSILKSTLKGKHTHVCACVCVGGDFTMLAVSRIIASNDGMIDEWWTRRDLEGNGRGLVQLLPQFDFIHFWSVTLVNTIKTTSLAYFGITFLCLHILKIVC
jgi:hypothetical protein